MFNKNDPLIDSVSKIMKENQIRRDVEQALNEELGIYSKKDLPFQQHAEYDAVLEEAVKKALHPNQQKLDVHEPEKDELTATDFKLLRSRGSSKEKKPKEYGVETERKKASKGQEMYESNSDTYKAQNLYDKAHSQATKSGKSEKEAHAYASAEMKKKYPNHTASSSGEGQVYKTSMKEEQLDEATYSPKKARADRDIGKPGKMFNVIAKKAEKQYGSEERGKKVAGAVLAKLRGMKEQSDTHDIEFPDGTKAKALGKNKDDLSDFNKTMAKQPETINFPGDKQTYRRDPESGDYSAQRDSRSAKEPAGMSASSAGPKSIQFSGSATTYTRNASGEYEAPKTTSKPSAPAQPKYKSSIYPDDATKDPAQIDAPRSSGATYNPGSKRTASSIKKALSEPLKTSASQANRDRLNERKMTDAEMAKREKIVKSMKKGMAGFKERYGKKAKDVMYATATKQAMKEATDIDSIMEEIARNLNEKAYKMLEAPFHEAAAWFNSLNEEQLSLLDEQSFMDTLKNMVSGAAKGGATPAGQPRPTTSLALGGASTQASAPPVGAGPGSRAEPRPFGGIGAMGGAGTAAAEKAKGTTSIAMGGASVKRPEETDRTPVVAKAPTPASTPSTSERVASQQAGTPDSRNLRTAVKPAAGEGATGKALAGLGVSRADRLNPNFLKTQGITARPGSAEANLALRAKMGAQKTAVTRAERPIPGSVKE